jgi:hypothetical protein
MFCCEIQLRLDEGFAIDTWTDLILSPAGGIRLVFTEMRMRVKREEQLELSAIGQASQSGDWAQSGTREGKTVQINDHR